MHIIFDGHPGRLLGCLKHGTDIHIKAEIRKSARNDLCPAVRLDAPTTWTSFSMIQIAVYAGAITILMLATISLISQEEREVK